MPTMNIPKKPVIAWALYDWANSAFATVVTTFIFAAYFTRKIATNEIIGTKEWGYAIALAGVIIVFLSPISGAIADLGGRRKPWLGFFTYIMIFGAAMLWFAKPAAAYNHITLLAVIIGTIGIEIGQVFYNALLPNIASPKYFGRVSGWAWGLGYAGGLTALIICLYAFVQTAPAWLNTATAENVRICGPFVALWIFIFSLPIFIWVPDYPASGLSVTNSVKKGLKTLVVTLKNLPKQKNIFLFLIAHMVYLDGLNTVFAFGGIYAAGTFGMDIDKVIKFGIATNISAGIGAAIFAWVDDYIGAKRTILLALLALFFFGTGIVLIKSISWFWILAICLSLFFGPVQAASRSLMTRLVPKEKITEMFGLYALTGKVTAFLGPWLVATMTYHFASQRAGIASVLSFFIIGAILLSFVEEPEK